MEVLGTQTLLIVPVRRGDRVVGAVWLEDPADRPEVRDFAAAVANMVALGLGDPTGDLGRATQFAVAAKVPEPENVHSHTAELKARHPDRNPVKAEDFANVTVAVLRFSDPQGHQEGYQGAAPTLNAFAHAALADLIACALQEIAETHQLPYVKMVGEEAITAAGFASGDEQATVRIAEATLAMRDRCLALFEEAELTPAFRIGIDCGVSPPQP